jgi:hypothetical protein
MKILRMLGMVSAALVSFAQSGCGGCTEIGCDDALTVFLRGGEGLVATALPAKVHFCAGTTCSDATLDKGPQGDLECVYAGAFEGSCGISVGDKLMFRIIAPVGDQVHATIEVQGSDGATLFADAMDVETTDLYPNGESCGSACQNGSATFDASTGS